MLEVQKNGEVYPYNINHLCKLVDEYKSEYAMDLKMDTNANEKHGRIYFSFRRSNWNNFGKFYIRCILHCHKFKIPGNAFDLSLQHYQTTEYNKVYSCLIGEAEKINFVAFRSKQNVRGIVSQQCSAQVSRTISYVDNYRHSSYDWDDGCIEGDALILLKNGSKKMSELLVGDELIQGTVKWIIRIKNVNKSKTFNTYNGMTGSHPICENGIWKSAKNHSNPIVKEMSGDTIVYDVVLSERDISHMIVNNIQVAVVGYAVPGMIHPYWGSSKVINDIEIRYPNGGIIDVDGNNFVITDGLVSSIF